MTSSKSDNNPKKNFYTLKIVIIVICTLLTIYGIYKANATELYDSKYYDKEKGVVLETKVNGIETDMEIYLKKQDKILTELNAIKLNQAIMLLKLNE